MNNLIYFRNGKAAWLANEWAKANKVKIRWIYTETSHGKGPADPVSGDPVKICLKLYLKT